MPIFHSHSQPLLAHHHHDNAGDLLSCAQGSSSDGSFPTTTTTTNNNGLLRTRSHEDVRVQSAGSDEAEACFEGRRRAGDMGYVSFEDMVLFEAFREGNGRSSEAGAVTTASRMYTRVAHRRYRRRSPGPLGTRRGGAMHRFVKKFVCPCLAFVARAFGCMPGVPAH
ncbi:hypothetical protein D1007_14199 [Hordeum vulgare]|nr:hypothetical protein D1007_14199 [Hordeum vulgare]